MQDIPSKQSLVPNTSQTPFYVSVFFLVLITSAAIGLFFYNMSLDHRIDTYKSDISAVQSQIDEVSKDRNVIVAKIESSNTLRPSIDLHGIIANFYDAASRANVYLKGFSVTNDVISTVLISTESDGTVHPDAASTIIKMMREYALGPVGTFSLDPITSVTGDIDTRTTSIQLRVVKNAQ